MPLIVYGCGDEKKDVEVLTAVAEACRGENLLLGPAVKENYEAIARAVSENGHCIIAQTPIDINLEKELNVKLLQDASAREDSHRPPVLGCRLRHGIQLHDY